MALMLQSGPLRQNGQRGYILLTLMLFFALMAIMAVAIAPSIVFQIQRDREEELIHRGVQYSRATRRYFKKFGRYPTRIEDLENTNNIRFLRRRYKDPLTGKDFKLLHIGEVQLAMGAGIAGASSIGQPIGAGPAGTASVGPSGPGGRRADSGMPAALQPATQPQNAPAAGQTDADSNNSSSTNSGSANSSSTNSASSTGSTGGGDKLSAQVFGGGPIVGVASTSKNETIREFNKKNHYNDWQFIYDPGTDRGGLITTPAQPALQGSIASPTPVAPAVTGGFGGMSGGMSGQPGQPTSGQPPPGMQPQSPQR